MRSATGWMSVVVFGGAMVSASFNGLFAQAVIAPGGVQ